ncbi:LPXTG cell wall anchor domain-containing protein [Ammoniphilus sp. 3BR4]|uniref:LPXTG cell wall anchor domain-containing protein n=1 Tax=Ammoniphilus sp. 3BR4 TaxID=3158265 RepID=UPI003467CD7C
MFNQIGKISLILLVIFSAFSVSAFAQENRNVQFDIKFVSTSYDPDKNESVWTYQVMGLGEGPDLSHWMLELCPDVEVVGASHQYELQSKPDPISGLIGIKFEQPVKVDESVEYSIRVKGNWNQELITASMKGATDVKQLQVMGPGCATADGMAKAEEQVHEETKNKQKEKIVHHEKLKVSLKEVSYDENADTSICTFRVYGTETGIALQEWLLLMGSDVEIIEASHAYQVSGTPDPATGKIGLHFTNSSQNEEFVDFWIKVKGKWDKEKIISAGDGSIEVELTEVKEKHTITLLKAEVSSSRKVKIQAKLNTETEVQGIWVFLLGGKTYTVQGGSQIVHEIADAPAGTYHVKASFTPQGGEQIHGEEPVTIHVPTELGGTLPNTATKQYLWLFLGVLSTVAGVFLLKRKKGLV